MIVKLVSYDITVYIKQFEFEKLGTIKFTQQHLTSYYSIRKMHL